MKPRPAIPAPNTPAGSDDPEEFAALVAQLSPLGRHRLHKFMLAVGDGKSGQIRRCWKALAALDEYDA